MGLAADPRDAHLAFEVGLDLLEPDDLGPEGTVLTVDPAEIPIGIALGGFLVVEHEFEFVDGLDDLEVVLAAAVDVLLELVVPVPFVGKLSFQRGDALLGLTAQGRSLCRMGDSASQRSCRTDRHKETRATDRANVGDRVREVALVPFRGHGLVLAHLARVRRPAPSTETTVSFCRPCAERERRPLTSS